MSDHLTPKQELFCQKIVELLYTRDSDVTNASDAYRAAYDTEKMKPATIWREAHELLHNPKVAARIEELKKKHLKRHNVTVDRVLAEYAKIGFLDIRKAFDEDGNLKPIHELDDDTAAAIAGLEVEVRRTSDEPDDELEGQAHGGALKRQHGATARLHKIKLIDKKGALDSMAKHLGMFIDRSEVTLRKPISEMTDEEIDAEIAEYERTAGPVLPSSEG